MERRDLTHDYQLENTAMCEHTRYALVIHLSSIWSRYSGPRYPPPINLERHGVPLLVVVCDCRSLLRGSRGVDLAYHHKVCHLEGMRISSVNSWWGQVQVFTTWQSVWQPEGGVGGSVHVNSTSSSLFNQAKQLMSHLNSGVKQNGPGDGWTCMCRLPTGGST